MYLIFVDIIVVIDTKYISFGTLDSELVVNLIVNFHQLYRCGMQFIMYPENLLSVLFMTALSLEIV